MHEKLKAVSKFVNVLFLRGKNLPFTPLIIIIIIIIIYSTWWGLKFCYVSLTIHYVDKSGDETAASSILFLKHLHSFIYVKRMFFSC